MCTVIKVVIIAIAPRFDVTIPELPAKLLYKTLCVLNHGCRPLHFGFGLKVWHQSVRGFKTQASCQQSFDKKVILLTMDLTSARSNIELPHYFQMAPSYL